jgi:integrase
VPGHVSNRSKTTGERADGSTKWRAHWYHPDDRSVKKERTFRDKRTAQRWISELDRKAHDGMYKSAGSRKTWEDLVEAWRDTRYGELAPRSRSRYDQVLRTHLDPEFGGKRLMHLDREAVRRYIGRLARQVAAGNLSGGTVHKIHTVLSSILTEGVELEWIPANPARRVRGMPSAKRQRQPVFLTRPEAEALIAATDPRYQLLIRFAVFTGLRQSEVFALRRRHVDVLHGRVQVEEAIKEWRKVADQPRAPREPVFGETKSGRGRKVGLEPQLRTLLTEHLASLPGGPDALVFTNDHGAAIRETSWRRNFYRPAVTGALPNRTPTFHDLRHTCASWLIASGANALEVCRWMGHASISTTYDIYGHLMPDAVDDLAGRLAQRSEPLEPPRLQSGA